MEDLNRIFLLTQELGIIIKLQKSQLTLSQEILCLEMRLDSRIFRAFPSAKRIAGCLQTVYEFLALLSCLAHQWMSLLETLSSIKMFVKSGRLQ